MKSNLSSLINAQQNVVRGLIMGMTLAVVFASCKKEDTDNKPNEIIISETSAGQEKLSLLELPVEGGFDTLYVFSKSAIKAVFQTDKGIDWLSVEETTYLSDRKATRVVLKVLPLEESFDRRSGILNITNEEPYKGSFLKVTQGYISRLKENFSWLRYGDGNPTQENTAALISQWNVTQKNYGWTSSAGSGTPASVFGRNGYVQLGSETQGAGLVSPIISGMEKDSLMLLSFNAVAFKSKQGEADLNKLTVKLIGAEFEPGKSSKVIEIGHYDHATALLASKMWDQTNFSFVLKKTELNPNSSTLQVQFIGGEQIEQELNRIFIDNVAVYSVALFQDKIR